MLPSRILDLDADLHADAHLRFTSAMSELGHLAEEHPHFAERLQTMNQDFATYLKLQDTIVEGARNPDVKPAVTRTALAASVSELLGRMSLEAERMLAEETAEAEELNATATKDRRTTVGLLLGGGIVALLVAGFGVFLLLRNLVPRIQDYSRFATELASGEPPRTLEPAGDDELTELGRALNNMVDKNAERAAEEEVRRGHEQLFRVQEELQTEFVDTLQVTANEDEAHDLVQRQIERCVPDSVATVLKRNNSANRLQSATELDPGSPLAEALQGAEPRSCLSVRFARTHREKTGRPPLLSCALCTNLGSPVTCEPLLVGGEVIGSVVVAHEKPLTDDAAGRIKTTVSQAAPVLANLRNLALAEFRANNDSLTGLPNKRATDDTLKRMVAQANRALSPLAALMCDLDHFKQINDRFGHGKGDEVLAAVGTALQSCLRGSDFAGRFGGEEFLILLPDTDVTSATQVAEKIRRTVAELTVPGVERAITASLGVAGLPEHAGNADGLIREADRAMYAAKLGGRNQTIVGTIDAPQPLDDRAAPVLATELCELNITG